MVGSDARPLGRWAARAAFIAVGVLLLAPLPRGLLGIWQGELLDFGHVPLFAGLVLVLRASWGPPLGRAVIISIAVAGLAELIQPQVGRTGDWFDFFRGGIGALAAAAAIRAYEIRRSPARAATFLVLALALPTWPLVEVFPYVADTIHGYRAFPVITDFSDVPRVAPLEVRPSCPPTPCADGAPPGVAAGAGRVFVRGIAARGFRLRRLPVVVL